MADSVPARRAALAFIFVTVVLDMLALGVVIPVLPKLVMEFEHGDMATAAKTYGLFGTVWALMQFACSPLLGALSDRYGRRPVVLISNFGLGLDYVLMALAPSLGWLFVGRVISGITAASFSVAGAYIADVTPPEKRAASFGLLGVAFGLGFVLGPAVGGLAGTWSLRLPFWIAAGLSLANGCYGLFVLPESLPEDRRSPLSWRRANPIGSLALLRSDAVLFGLAVATFIANVAHDVNPSTFVLYVTQRYAWDERTVGLALAGVGIASAIVGGALVRPVVARFGARRVMLAGLACGAIGFAVEGIAWTGTGFFLGIPIVAMWGLAGPSTQGLMTSRVGDGEQGQLQGALASLRGIAELIGPGLFTQTFAAAIGPLAGLRLPGAPYLLAALLLGGSLAISARATRAISAANG